MSYRQALKEMVDKSGLTLREISKLCKDRHGVEVDASYISKLQKKEDQNPPSEKISRALALVCKGDPERLVLEGYLQKGPQELRDTLDRLANAQRDFVKSLLPNAPKDTASRIEEILDRMATLDIIKLVLEKGPGMSFIPLQEIREIAHMYAVKDGEPAFEEIEAITPELFRIPVSDSSMHPLIPNGSKVQLDSFAEIERNDIVVVVLPGLERVIRRYIPVGDRVILVPENRAYGVQEFNKDELVFHGKVKEVITEL